MAVYLHTWEGGVVCDPSSGTGWVSASADDGDAGNAELAKLLPSEPCLAGEGELWSKEALAAWVT